MWIWSFYAPSYDSLLKLKPYQELLKEIVARIDLKSGQKILDLGCGTGNLFYFLRSEAGFLPNVRMLGLDINRSMLKRAKTKFKKEEPLDFIRGNIEILPFKSNKFDAVIINNVLYVLADKAGLLKEINRLLKINGKIIISLPKPDGSPELVLKAHKYPQEPAEKWLNQNFFVWLWNVVRTFGPDIISVLKYIYIVGVCNKILKKQAQCVDLEVLSSLLKETGFDVLHQDLIYGRQNIFIVGRKRENSFTVKIAETQEELESVFRLRFETYTEELGSFKKETLAGGKEIDKYDQYSVHIIAKHGEVTIGTLRLIKDSPYGFLMEEAFELPKNIDRSRTVEHSRGIVKKEYRGAGLYSLLLEKAYEWQNMNGYTICCGAPNFDKLASILFQKGWQSIGPAREYHNIKVVPMIFYL